MADTGLRDGWNRPITYLRMSVTDVCPYHCIYCRPAGQPKRHLDPVPLSCNELIQLASLFVQAGIQKIRLTGGEPLTRDDLPRLIHTLSQMAGLEDLSLTTNGQRLGERLPDLVQAGLRRINISMDSLRADRFAQITGGGRWQLVWEGVQQARAVLPGPVKINVVVLQGWNEDEILDFARLTLDEPYHVRFIESMPLAAEENQIPGPTYSIERIQQRIREVYLLEPILPTEPTAGPAERYRIPGAAGEIGFIAAVTHRFCSTCNRLRLTADGRLRLCLLSNVEWDCRPWLSPQVSPAEVKETLRGFLSQKPSQHTLQPGLPFCSNRSMLGIGG